MRKTVFTALCLAFLLTQSISAQQGPVREPGETVARPKPKDEKAPPAKKPVTLNRQKDENLPSFKTDVSVVELEVSVVTDRGQFIPKIPKENLRIVEDGVAQNITHFSTTADAPMTVCLVIEFSNLFQQYWSESWYQTLTASYGFLETLKPEDWVAVVAYDMRPEILADFSQDKRVAQEGMQRLKIAAYSESNLFDALTDTAQRMQGLEGRKAIVLISSGVDTFSKLTFDKTRKILQEPGTPNIYAIGLMQAMREWYDARGYMSSIARMDFLQADNQLRTFAKETGGQSFFPRFYGEFPSIFQTISQALRSQYVLTYQSTNPAKDGKFRKVKVELIDPATGKPLRITDEKGKTVKYQVLTRSGYTAPREVE